MRNGHALHGARFLVYAMAGGLVAALALWSTIARGADLTGPVKMDLADAASCARFRQAGAAVAGVAPCSVGLGRLRLKCENDPNCTSATSAKTWTFRPANWLEKRWAATPTPSPRPTVTPRPTASARPTPSPKPTEIDACPGGCLVYDFDARKATCRRPCPK